MAGSTGISMPLPSAFGGGPGANIQSKVVDPSAGKSFNTVLQQLLGGVSNLKPSNYQDLLSQGVNSPLMQEVLKPALNNLLPGQQIARQNLMDEFRASGSLGSGAMGNASVQLENAFQGQEGNLISQVMSSLLPTMTSGLSNQFTQQMAPLGLLAQILGQTRPNILTPSGTSGGGSGGGGNIQTSDPLAGMLGGLFFGSGGIGNTQAGSGGFGYAPVGGQSGDPGQSYISPDISQMFPTSSGGGGGSMDYSGYY